MATTADAGITLGFGESGLEAARYRLMDVALAELSAAHVTGYVLRGPGEGRARRVTW